MSIESVAIALHHSRAKGTAKLVLIGIANHDGDGGAWPSVKTLAKYAGVHRTNVQAAIQRLESLHEIVRHVQAGGDHRYADYERPNRYDFLLRCPANCDRTSKHRTTEHEPLLEPETDPAPLAGPGTAGGATPAPLPVPKPSTNHPSTSKKRTHVGNRAREVEVGACGHELIDDRHCARGCASSKVIAA